MKKLLLSITLALTLQCINAQVLESDNFTSLTVGNIGTDLTGVTAGQGGWLTFVSATSVPVGQNSDFQIESQAAPNGKVVKLTGASTASGTRFLFKDALATSWPLRTPLNEIIEIEFDINVGAASTSLNGFRAYIYSTDGTKVLGGIGIPKNFVYSTVNYTNPILGYYYFVGTGGTGTYYTPFGPSAADPMIVVNNNTWVRIGCSFNKTTGEVKWKGPGFNLFTTGSAVGIDPGEVDFVVTTATGNTVAASAFIDNYVARASSTDTLLGVETRTRSVAVSTYPNPTVDFINVYNSNNLELSSYKIVDLKGTVIRSGLLNNSLDQQINVAELSQGIY
ncbi:MAG: hypothetical protein RL308_2167, partial [Bacteroidota bacterium]